MVSYYNPLSYTQCANLYPMSNSWYSAAAAANYQQPANGSPASFFGGAAAAAAAGNGIHQHHHHHQSNATGGGGFGGGGSNAPGSGGGGSPDSEGGQQSPMYYQHYQHAMFQQGSPEWQALDRSGSPPPNGSVRQNRMFQYPGFGGSSALSAAQQSHDKMLAAATDLRTTTNHLSMDKLGNHPHLTALPSPPISSPGGNCQNIKQGKTRTEDKYRVVYTDFQRMELEKEYSSSKYITIRRKTELSNSLDLSERQVKIWFQNRRAKDRKINKKTHEVAVVGMHHHHQQLQQQGGYMEDGMSPFNPFAADIKPKTEPGLHFQHAAAFHHQMNQHMHGMGLHHATNYSQHALHHHNLGMSPIPGSTNIPPSIAPSDSPVSINS